jgi:hypothetical protein
MGHKFSAVHGVKSDNFYQQGNAINEIWIDDVELISRLPFGDSDLEQAGWPPGSWPKIPWHQFVIPLKRNLDTAIKAPMSVNSTTCNCPALPAEYHLPDTGPLSIANALSPGWAFLLGCTCILVGLLMCIRGLIDLHKARATLRVWERVRVRVFPFEYIPDRVKRYFWVTLGFDGFAVSWGILLVCVGVPFTIRGIQGVSANSLFLPSVFFAVGFITGLSILSVIYLVICLRWALKAIRQTLDVVEKPDGAASPILTVDEFDQRLKQRLTCPECKKLSLFG